MVRNASVPSFGLFAEGSSYTDRNRKPFEELWELLANRCGQRIHLKIYGFDKTQIIAMNPPTRFVAMRERLDVYIERMHERDSFDNLIVAFDRIPKNDYLGESCLRTEVNFVLEALATSATLNARFRDEAQRLLETYKLALGRPRASGRPPRGPLDIIYMDPMFEGVFLSDEASVLKGLGHRTRPKGWPTFDPYNQHPDRHILAKAVKLADASVRNRVRGDLKSNKAGWALQICVPSMAMVAA